MEEANAWWQAKLRGRESDVRRMAWETFEAELWTRFGPTDEEDFEEALCHIRQKGTLLEYQREFEWFGTFLFDRCRSPRCIPRWSGELASEPLSGAEHSRMTTLRSIRVFSQQLVDEGGLRWNDYTVVITY